MPAKIDLSNQTFNRWTFQRRHKGSLWWCRCECGTERLVDSASVKSGLSKSCGCFQKDQKTVRAKSLKEKHPSSYSRWANMIQRCTNPNNPAFDNYGGRGITVCERWRLSFEDFLADVGDPPFDGASIDRYPDNDGNYESGNVRWATASEQGDNKRTTRLLEFRGEFKSVKRWAIELGINYGTLYHRVVDMGLSVADAIEFHRDTLVTHDGVARTITEWSKITGLVKETIAHRLKVGLPPAVALTAAANTLRSAVTYRGVTKTLSGWASATGLSKAIISIRLKAGWSVERTLTTPPRKRPDEFVHPDGII